MSDKIKERSKALYTQEKLNRKFSLLRTSLAIAIGVLLSIIIILVVSDDPAASIKFLVIGPILNYNNFCGLLTMWIPIVITGLAVCIMFSANQFNLFGEGAFFFGGVVATMVALSTNMITGIHAVICIIAAAIVCGLIGVIPAVMKYKLGASEMVGSMLLNYACMNLGLFIISYFFRDPSAGTVVSEKIPKTAKIPTLLPHSDVHMGIIVAVVLVILAYIFMYHTRWGYEIRLVGQNEKFAKYAGVNIGFVLIGSQIIGGALSGAAGAMEVLGSYSRFSWTTLTGHGWDGVTLGILANRNPKYIPLAALFLAYLRKGADLMSMKTGMQTDFISVIQAVILVFLLAEQFLSKYKQKKTDELSKYLEIAEKGGATIG
ncbi:MAG: ABC transporter permease [Lachnospiraceae bacterium]|nr:ABC transporter permease [Lachnospiraceae bacterium]